MLPYAFFLVSMAKINNHLETTKKNGGENLKRLPGGGTFFMIFHKLEGLTQAFKTVICQLSNVTTLLPLGK